MNNPNEVRAAIAVVVMDDDNRVVLQKRKDVGLWGLPSGHVEPGETISEAAVREVKEETNLDINIMKLIGVYSEPSNQSFTYPDGNVVHFITTCFLAEITGGTISPCDAESIDVDIFDQWNIPKDLIEMHPKWLQDACSTQQKAFIR
ncbi:NUDIX domain-containing protein [Pontibacillus yanchengensis]|uniref:DNA mismatch repair protein MutT n=1 Tax=Pontibacillus yanchengensis Y32 TaxID=1385514 RepID=A0A0A2T543_9BACI|nr:NUDIX domain-containing protein [Pontibacillus yanchengensis]KGP70867.1 DNA mismatch repair protein MutT [Pontibacillus yanchengensis Y32]